VITLVFFVLATLGLGVSTYFGYSEQDAKDRAVKEAKGNEEKFKNGLRWYQGQAWVYRAYMGHTQNLDAAELAQVKDQIDKGALGKGEKDQEDVKRLVNDTLDKKLGWDATGKKARASYEDLLVKDRNDYEALDRRATGLQASLAAAEKKAKDAEDQLREAEKSFQQELVKATQKAKEDRSDDRKEIDNLRNEVAKLSQDKENLAKGADESRRKVEGEVKKRDTQLRQQREVIEARNAELAQFKTKTDVAPPTMRTDWKIVRMDQRGTMPYINLGSADQVKPQLTFSIHGLGAEGRPTAQAKGTLEVVSVLGEHLSQARITSVKDPNRDPVLTGDVLYNPLWNPNLKKHVAVAGLVDLTRGARNPESGLADFLRQLERQNIVVDAWLDPRDFTVKGPGITVQTDYLVEGEGLDFFGDSRSRDIELSKKLTKAMQDMKDQAARNGVAVIGLRKYLEMIGYRLPPHLAEPSNVSPAYKPRPDQLPPPPATRPPVEKEKPEPKAGPKSPATPDK
jgi:hypothetical protein